MRQMYRVSCVTGRPSDIGLQPTVLAAGKGRGGDVLISSVSLLSFIFLFLPCPSLSSLSYMFYHSSPFLREMTQKDPQGLTCH